MALSEILLISMGLLLIAILASGLFRRITIPYTVLLVIIGIFLSELSGRWPFFEPLHHFRLTPELVFFLFLPALIFESGLNLNARQLLKNLAPVLTLAVPALLISTGIIGVGIWAILGIDLTTSLLFGALISATDPVAVVALFKEIGAPIRLNVLVEGESLFNDATAIVVFGILLGMVVSGESLSGAGIGAAAMDFIRVFLGGVVVGSLIGLVLCELLSRLRIDNGGILTLSVVMAYASFILAEHILHVSGVMATVGAALTLGSFGINRLPTDAEKSLAEIWEFLAFIANSLLFLLVGLSINVGDLVGYAGAISIAIFLVLFSRASTVYTLVPLTTRFFKLPVISRNEQHIMWWGGLKGGLAIAIVLSIPEQTPGREMLISLTLGVVLFTLLINASTIRLLMQKLGMDKLTPDEMSELHQGNQAAEESALSQLHQFSRYKLLSDNKTDNLQSDIEHCFREKPSDNRPDLVRRRTYLIALRTELNGLEELFHLGVIDQYTYMDIRNTLITDRERHKKSVKPDELPPPKSSIFVRLEQAVIQRLREKNWATRLLARYQISRLHHRLQRDIAGIVMCNAVLERLSETDDLDPEEAGLLRELYQDRLKRRTERIGEIKASFPELFNLFENSVFSRAAYSAAAHRLETVFHLGQIGSKAYQRLAGHLDDLIGELRTIHLQLSDGNTMEWIHTIPLFQDMTEDARLALCDKVREVTYLRNDTIIGEGERGDALYVIKQGEVKVLHDGKEVARLKDKEFFGETALLGDHTRTATVIAAKPTKLWRLSRKDVFDISDHHSELLRDHLESESALRQGNSSPHSGRRQV